MFQKLITIVSLVLVTALPALALSPPPAQNEQVLNLTVENDGIVQGAGFMANTGLGFSAVTQTGTDHTGLIRTAQAELGMVGQGLGIGALAGQFGVGQEGSIYGWQKQWYPNASAGMSLGQQWQSMNAGIPENLMVASPASQGMAVGLQAISGVQVQIIATPWGTNMSLTPVMMNVYGSIAK